MEVWEEIVNKNSNAKKHNESHTRKKLFQHRAIIASVVAIAFVLTTSFNLVHQILGESGMVVSLLIAFYNLGRAKEC